ncbi:MAG: rhomboid family intramembrane serine protease, partial [Planctomycetota bacterium]
MTLGLVGANLAVAFVAKIPGFPDEDAVLRALGQDRAAVAQGECWRILTGPFAHAGAAHLAMNLIGLAILGRILERGLGHARFAFLYALSAVSGALFFQVFSSGDLGLGASGAVYGAFGFLLAARSATRRSRGGGRLAAFLLWTAVVFGLDQAVALSANLLSGVQIASSAHFGGFAAGALLAVAWLPGLAPA